MLDENLLQDIRELSESAGVAEMSDIEARRIVSGVENSLVEAASGRWWWDCLAMKSVAIDYEADAGFLVLEKLVEKSKLIYLVPTDDEYPPWPVFVEVRSPCSKY